MYSRMNFLRLTGNFPVKLKSKKISLGFCSFKLTIMMNIKMDVKYKNLFKDEYEIINKLKNVLNK